MLGSGWVAYGGFLEPQNPTPSTDFFGLSLVEKVWVKLCTFCCAALRKSFFCPRLVLGLSLFVLFVVFTMSLWCPSYVLCLSSSLNTFLMLSLTLFSWMAFSKIFKGVQKGCLCSSSSPFHVSWRGRTSWVCHQSFIRPSAQISRALPTQD